MLAARRTSTYSTCFSSEYSNATLSLAAPLRVRDRIHIVGHTTDLIERVDRLQIEHSDVPEAGPGQDVALHVRGKVREHDEVRKIEGEQSP